MRSFLRHQLWPAIASLVVLTLITGFLYPAAVTAVAQVAFPSQANGSLLVVDGKTVGSSIIGQAFNDPRYFWSRPSAAGVSKTNPGGYDPTSSGASNLGPNSKALIDAVSARVDALRKANGNAPIPVDLVTSSGSGLDPDISPAAADYQVGRVAAARGMDPAAVRALVRRHTEGPILGFLGASRVNVLLLNMDLDGLLR